MREYEVQLPVLNLLFSDERYSVFFLFRTWKLNAFSSCAHKTGNSAVHIRFCHSAVRSLDGLERIYIAEEFPFSRQIHRLSDSQFVFTYYGNRVYLQYLYDTKESSITLLEDQTETDGFAAIEYLSRLLPGLLLQQEALTIHGVLMEHDGRGIIVSAPSGVGKTTHTHLWRDHKHAITLNGDLSACYLKQTDHGPIWTGFGTPWCGTSGECMNREVPITAIVALERADQNEAVRLDGFEAFKAVIPQLQLPAWDKRLAETGADLLIEMLNTIPVIRLRCRPDVDAVDTLDQALQKL